MGCRRNSPYTYQNRAEGTSFCSKCASHTCKCINYGLDTLRNTAMVNRKYIEDNNSNLAHRSSSVLNVSSPALDLTASAVDLRINPRIAPSPIDLSLSSSYYSSTTDSQSMTTVNSGDIFFRKPRPTSIGFLPPNDTGSRAYHSSSKYKLSHKISPKPSPTRYGDPKTLSSSECSPDCDSSPMYCSTSTSNNSQSSPSCTTSSLSSTCSSPLNLNSHVSANYAPLSPSFSSKSPTPKYSRTNFEEYSPLSPKTPQFRRKSFTFTDYTPPSLEYSPDSPQYSPKSPNCCAFSPKYSPRKSSQYKYTSLDYSLASPQSLVYDKYSPPSPKYPVSSTSYDNKPKSPTFIDNSPISPLNTPSSSSYSYSSPQNTSPEYSPLSWSYLQNSCNNNKLKSPSSPQYRNSLNDSPPSPKYYIDTHIKEDNLKSSRKHRSLPPKYYIDLDDEDDIEEKSKPKSSVKFGSAPPKSYPLSPEYSPRKYPSMFNGRSVPDDDIPCVCCSPPRYK